MTSIPAARMIDSTLTLIQYIGDNSISIESLPGVNNIAKIAKIINGTAVATWENGIPDDFQGFTSLDRLSGYLIVSKPTASLPYNIYSVPETIPNLTKIENQFQILSYFCENKLISDMGPDFSSGVLRIAKIVNNSFSTWDSSNPEFLQGFLSLEQGATYLFSSSSNSLPIILCDVGSPTTPTPTPSPTPCLCNYNTALNSPSDGREGVSISSDRSDIIFKFDKITNVSPPDFMVIYLNNLPICTITYNNVYENRNFCLSMSSKNYCGLFTSGRLDFFDNDLTTPTPTATSTPIPTPTPEPQLKCINTQYINSVLNNFAESRGVNISGTSPCEFCYFEKDPSFPQNSMQINFDDANFIITFSNVYLGDSFAITYNETFYEFSFIDGTVNN